MKCKHCNEEVEGLMTYIINHQCKEIYNLQEAQTVLSAYDEFLL